MILTLIPLTKRNTCLEIPLNCHPGKMHEMEKQEDQEIGPIGISSACLWM